MDALLKKVTWNADAITRTISFATNIDIKCSIINAILKPICGNINGIAKAMVRLKLILI